MQYALVNGDRQEAFTSGRGHCPMCGAAVIAKCGPRIIHHWAHAVRRNCDPWWENETEWHRLWKSFFPVECREISRFALNGELHRADVVTPTGIVIEFQHSAITDVERKSRESFYGNMIWIVDGRSFRNNFDVYHILPDPDSEIAQDLVWVKASRCLKGAAGGMCFRLSEARRDYPEDIVSKATLKFGRIHSLREIQLEIERAYRGLHQYDWIRPRRTWLEAGCLVYIDFGIEHLVRLETYDESDLPCVRYVAKVKFLHDVVFEADTRAVATEFTRINYPV